MTCSDGPWPWRGSTSMCVLPPNHNKPTGSFSTLSSDFTELATSPYWWVQSAAPGNAPSRTTHTALAKVFAFALGMSATATLFAPAIHSKPP